MSSRVKQLTELREYRPRDFGIHPRVLDIS
jgi:hypothetical protein